MNGYPYQQQPQQPGFPGYPPLNPSAPQEPGYPVYQQPQPGYPVYQQAPNMQSQPGYVVYQQTPIPGYATPQQANYAIPQQPGYGIPQQPNYAIPQPTGFTITLQPQQPVAVAPKAPVVASPAEDWEKLNHHSSILNVHIGRRNHIGMIATNQNMFYAKNDQWYRFDDGAAVVISASKNDSSFWCINSQDMIFRRRDIYSGWEQMPGRAIHVSATSYDSAVVSNRELLLFEWSANQNNWRMLGGDGRGTSLTLGTDGSIFVIGTTGLIYEYRHGRWYDENKLADNIDVLNSKRRVCVKSGRLYFWKYGSWEEMETPYGRRVRLASISLKAVCLLMENGDCYIKNC